MLTVAQLVLIPLALGAVALVLILGLANMARGGSPQRSQLLMRWRIGLQFVAFCLVLATVYFMHQG
ncbi:MAG TPA: twin transmembrane helix small protein [Xanthobacteraceae bacterium]|nr:twin transmembrane helix small protein [Xanthobacteraceae bacterium]